MRTPGGLYKGDFPPTSDNSVFNERLKAAVVAQSYKPQQPGGRGCSVTPAIQQDSVSKKKKKKPSTQNETPNTSHEETSQMLPNRWTGK